jgi:RNA methyltransferase, TrmH family
MDVISSRQNPLVRRFREVARDPGDSLLLDGPHLIEEALAAALRIETLAVDSGAHEAITTLARRALASGARVVSVPAAVLAAMSPVRNPAGIVAIAARPAGSLDAALDGPAQMVLMIEDVQDPGNLGAIVRVAEACGATGIVVGSGSADPFGWKALRGSMGSAFRVPIAGRLPLMPAIDAARQRGLRVLASVPRDGTQLPDCDLRRPVAVLLGGEGPGLSDEVLARADERLTIHMRPPVESLNVATAAALIVYEAERQRGVSNEAERQRGRGQP